MLQENELITLLLSIGVLVFVQIKRERLKDGPSLNHLIISFSLLSAGWGFTLLEGFFLRPHMNVLEHACYAGSSVFLAAWCWKTFQGKEEA